MADLQLSPYQQTAVERLLGHRRHGLFDEHGAAKSAPVIVAAQQLPGPRLFSCPTYLVSQWAYEIGLWWPQAWVSRAVGTRAQRDRALEDPEADCVVVGYASWSARTKDKRSWLHHQLHRRRWGLVVLDESQYLRNRRAQVTRHVHQLPYKIPVWHQTGTPEMHNMGDLWPFLYMCDPSRFSSYWQFVRSWARIVETPWEYQIGPVRDRDAFASMLAQYSLRRRLCDIPELAHLEWVAHDLWVDLDSAQRKRVDALARDTDVPGGVRVHQIRQELGSGGAKLEAYGHWLRDTPDRVVVFCWYQQTAQAAASAVDSQRLCGMVTGGMSARERDAILERYNQHGDGVIVATIGALRYGVNLQAGHRVCFLEESATPADNQQAIGRCLRRGQQHTVLVTRILAARTRDQKLRHLLERRSRRIQQELMDDLPGMVS